MEASLVKLPERSRIEKLSVVGNFRQAMEARDISLMKSELYAFLTLHCGFIAHYNIDGFKAAYSSPKDFAGVFIRHFDRKHAYFYGVHNCDEKAYRETGYTIAEIKQEFHRIVAIHLDEIARWADGKQRIERLEAYKMQAQTPWSAVKHLTRAGMGRCQGGFCGIGVLNHWLEASA